MSAPDPAEVRALREALEAIEFRATNHGGWFEQDPFGEYAKLGSMATEALSTLRGTEAPPVAGMGEDLIKALIEQVKRYFTGTPGTAKYEFGRRIIQALERPPVAGGSVGELRELVFESLYHLRIDDAAKRYHEKATAALTKPTPPASVSGEVVVQADRISEDDCPYCGGCEEIEAYFADGSKDCLPCPHECHRLAAAPEAATPSAVGGVDRLREAFGRLIRVAAGEAASEDPQGIDGSEIDAAYDALWASYPVVFTDEQVEALRAWQDCGHTHSLTCANQPHGFFDEDGNPVDDDLVATRNGLFCVGCDYRQIWAPEACFGPLPLDPRAALATGETSPERGAGE